jgi:hypothetical protein
MDAACEFQLNPKVFCSERDPRHVPVATREYVNFDGRLRNEESAVHQNEGLIHYSFKGNGGKLTAVGLRTRNGNGGQWVTQSVVDIGTARVS